MSDDVDDRTKLVKISLTECEHGNMHVTGIEPITDADILYDAPDSDVVPSSSTVGWSHTYAANWEANFGEKSEPELN